ncbi:hypothetical protein [Microbacterium sediminis]|uniref:hypothetical protein n=1 Tax=Microbacterium sediminis TaxID=904291 RepID=UPI00114721F6|nr:hypothetical protein [Microbacterium sediminis]
MVWWRGLGGLGFIFAVLGGFAGAGIAAALRVDGGVVTAFIGGGIILGGAASFALGWYLNVVRPVKQTDEWAAGRQQLLDHQVATGQFRYPTDTPPPASIAEAQSQAQTLLAWERENAHKAYRNNHSVYSIPLQWFGVVVAVIGLVVVGLGVAAAFGG